MAKAARGRSALLNLPGYHSTAAISAVVTDHDPMYQSVQLSDCSRQINLEFGLHSAGDFENSVYKIDTLIDCLRKFRTAYVALGRKKGYRT
jgi:hypothetical protein